MITFTTCSHKPSYAVFPIIIFLLITLIPFKSIGQVIVDYETKVRFDKDVCTYYPASIPVKSSITAPNFNENNNLQRGTNCSTFIVNYNGFTPEAEAAFQYAVDIWSNLLESNIPIRVNATFGPLDPGVLGGAGPADFIPLTIPGVAPNTAFPIALAEKLTNSEIPTGPNPNSTDINATFSSTANFYFGLDANTPIGQIDFVSVVLHELGHGLGIVGFARVDDDDNPTQGELRVNSFISIWDNFIENGMPNPITSFTDPSMDLLNEYTSNNLFCNSATAITQNSNIKPSTYAPSTFNQGSSYSHWDESIYPAGNPNSLMTPFIAPGEAIHDPGLVLLGFMEDMGWSICGGSLNVKDYVVDDITINPNPFFSFITIHLNNELKDDYSIDLYDINGCQIIGKILTPLNGQIQLMELDNLGKSLYFLKITNTNTRQSITKKLIKE